MTYQRTALDWRIDPLEALARWPVGRRVLMLHSGRADGPWSRYSLLAGADGAYGYRLTEEGPGTSEWLTGPSGWAPGCTWSHRPFRDLNRVLADRSSLWIGHLSYDIGRYIEKLPSIAKTDRHWPIIQMHRCPGWLVYDHQACSWSACGSWGGTGYGMPELPTLPVNEYRFCAGSPTPLITRHAYEASVFAALQYIAAGDIFQVNLTQRFTADCSGDPRGLYLKLARRSPAWYGAYLELDDSAIADSTRGTHRTIVCNSPELFFSLERNGRVVTRPIKGTRPASCDSRELLASAKDHAELTMIVDLLRNDLGRVCDYGSVRVPQPRVLESHPTVHHTTATITGTLHPSMNLIDLMRAVMPGGSITGVPKVRAMQIIDELEPVRRGPYTGAIGFVHDGSACFNIAIRSMLVETDRNGEGRVDYGVGGGIVADSTPAREYQETLDKAAAMNAALCACQEQRIAHV